MARWMLPLIVVVLLVRASDEAVAAFTPTGDALYDRYAQAALEGPALPWGPGAKLNPTTLPDSLLASWEKDFGGDKRYWELRFWCSALRHFDPLNKDSDPDFTHTLRFIFEAQKRGAADAETLLLAKRAVFGKWNEEQEVELDKADAWGEGKGHPGSKAAGPFRPLATILRDYEERERDYLDSAVKLSPDQAWPHWVRADFHLWLGENDLALADLKAGNSAPQCVLPAPFPASFVLDRMEAGKSVGSEALAGAVLLNALRSRLYCNPTDAVYWKERFKENEVMLNLGEDLELTQALYGLACRMALAKRNNRFTYFVCGVLAGIPASSLLRESGGDLSAEQRDTLMTLYRAMWELPRKEKKRSVECWYLDPALASFLRAGSDDPAFDVAAQLLVPTGFASYDFEEPEGRVPQLKLMEYRAMPGLMYKRFYEVWAREDAWADEQYKWFFQQLSQYDYRTMALPESWGGYLNLP